MELITSYKNNNMASLFQKFFFSYFVHFWIILTLKFFIFSNTTRWLSHHIVMDEHTIWHCWKQGHQEGNDMTWTC